MRKRERPDTIEKEGGGRDVTLFLEPFVPQENVIRKKFSP